MNKRSKNLDKRPNRRQKCTDEKIALRENHHCKRTAIERQHCNIHRARRSAVYGATWSDTLERTPVTISFDGRTVAPCYKAKSSETIWPKNGKTPARYTNCPKILQTNH